MAELKTRETFRDLKTLDKAAAAAGKIRKTTIRTRNQIQELNNGNKESPAEYAEDNSMHALGEAAKATVQIGTKIAKKTIRSPKVIVQNHTEQYGRRRYKDSIRKSSRRRDDRLASKSADIQEQSHTFGSINDNRHKVASVRKPGLKRSIKPVRSLKKTARSVGRAAVRTADHAVNTSERALKTAEQTSKVTIKTSKTAVKAAERMIQMTAKATKQAAAAAKKATQATTKAVKALQKALSRVIKAIIAGIAKFIGFIAAGGWIVVLVVVFICMVGLVVGSMYGIFLSGEDSRTGMTIKTVVHEINDEYLDQIEGIKKANAHDKVDLTGSKAAWKEVLSVYAIKVNTDPDDPQEVASMNVFKSEILKDIFWEMNEIAYRIETKKEKEIVETADEEGNIEEEEQEVTKTILFIETIHKTADEMADILSFNDEQKRQLVELLDEKNDSLWSDVLYGIHAADGQIVEVALTQLGNEGGMPYWSWYGFEHRVEWCACFVSWCANECGYLEDGIIPKYAKCTIGVKWFRDREQWLDRDQIPEPGMIIFFDWNYVHEGQDGQADHTGIVESVENGIVHTVEGNASDECRQCSYPVGYYEILGYGSPDY